MALQRADLDLNALRSSQLALFQALHHPLDEEALADMLAYWRFDLRKLSARANGGFAKPQIDVRIEITTKGNLKAEWFPRDGEHGDNRQSDIPHFRRHANRSYDITSRPTNELIFLRSFREVLHCFLDQENTGAAPLNAVLLGACHKAVELLKERLSYHFDVRMLTDVFIKWEEIESESGRWWNDGYRLVSWEIGDPRERKRAAELLELEQIEELYGFSESALLEAGAALAAKLKLADETPLNMLPADKLAKGLRDRGCAKAGKRSVERVLALIAEYRKPPPPSNVVQLRSRPDKAPLG